MTRLVISGAEGNLWLDPLFEEPGEYDKSDGLIGAENGGIEGIGSDDYTSYTQFSGKLLIQATQRGEFHLSAHFDVYPDGSSFTRGPEIRVRPVLSDGAILGPGYGERVVISDSAGGVFEGVYTVPDDPDVVEIQIGFGTGFDTQSNHSFRITDLNIRHKLYDGRLVVDGTIDTRHLNVTESMTAALLAAKKIEAGEIKAGAIDGMTITGGVISGGRVEGGRIVGAGIAIGQENTYGIHPFEVSTQGEMRATGATVDGRIIARSADLEGELRVGPNGEGGLTPHAGRLRIRGRLPANSGGARDMFVTGNTAQFSQFVTHTLSSGERHDIVYPAPKPSSTTRVVATALSNGTSANINVNTWSEKASGFSAIAMASTAPGRDLAVAITLSYRISYIAYWRD